ncbi:hypothetical protein K388_05555 [Streptomyces sp. KhCrAH-43]|uniref:hypothetical protein n=1 Tax=unclassified Streptomyces TaxID=2593676 RepID=UPI0003609454|nr:MULTISPECIES: hypothetical protein [unclassified Streptomyces]RAJ53768.1 hypothetical protein K388_05555 [Streptomyces sp. KhCrAH-43]
MSRFGELIPHREDDDSCLCGCQDEERSAPFVAHYWRHHVRREEECGSLAEAVQFLANGWSDGDLSQEAIHAPDGSIALAGQELLDAISAELERQNEITRTTDNTGSPA